MPTFVSVSDEILDDRNGRRTQKKSIGNKYNVLKHAYYILEQDSMFYNSFVL